MRCYSHLSDDEREQIGVAKAVGHSIGAIAKAIGRPKSTVSRELLRNRLPSGRYSPLHAAGAYQLRRRRDALIERDRALRTFVVDRLAEGWTPEQISGWLKGGNEPRLRAVGCETIYAFIYRTAQQAEQLWRYLTRRHKRRRPRRSRPSRDTIKDRVSIRSSKLQKKFIGAFSIGLSDFILTQLYFFVLDYQHRPCHRRCPHRSRALRREGIRADGPQALVAGRDRRRLRQGFGAKGTLSGWSMRPICPFMPGKNISRAKSSNGREMSV